MSDRAYPHHADVDRQRAMARARQKAMRLLKMEQHDRYGELYRAALLGENIEPLPLGMPSPDWWEQVQACPDCDKTAGGATPCDVHGTPPYGRV